MTNSKAPKTPKAKRKCKNCGEEFTPYRDWQIYCTPRCRALHYWNTHEVIKTENGPEVVLIEPTTVMPEQQTQTKTTS